MSCSRAEIVPFFDGLDLIGRGLVPLGQWWDARTNADSRRLRPEGRYPVAEPASAEQGSTGQASTGQAVAQPAISVRGLRKSFGGKEAVAGIDLDIAKGSLAGLVGPNGA
ncbi:MAG TPA: hypothetical protein VI365_04550, partial [Trebonia sp.]